MLKSPKKIALVGAPNVGKSVIFNRLTGIYATVSNYPGTTVEVARGEGLFDGVRCEVIDTPGLYSLYPVTEDERISKRIILEEGVDLIVHVVEAKNLERMLPLTFQLMEAGARIILVLNMFDEASQLGFTIDTGRLATLLGIPVVATVAITGQGVGQLRRVIQDQLRVRGGVTKDEGRLPAEVPTDVGTKAGGTRDEVMEFSHAKVLEHSRRAREISAAVMKKVERQRGLSRLDKLIISPLTGFPILALVLYLGLYKLVGGFGAGTVVDFLEGGFEKYINPWVTNIFERIMPWHVLNELFVGEYGIITLGIRYAVAIVLPIVGIFFFVFAIIEDSGYLPRLAHLLDRLFKTIGLSGRAVIPMVLGLGCDTMATMVTRTLPTKRERVIATLLLSLCVPCSAQLGVILGLLSSRPKVLISWAIIIAVIFAFVGTAAAKLLPGTRPSFIIEIPPMRFPQIRNVLVKTLTRMEWYFKEIVPLFILASALIWLGQVAGVLGWLVKIMAAPLSIMGLPAASAPAFIFGFFRRDYGAAGLYDLDKAGGLTNNQLLVAVVVLTLFLPCIAQLLITVKERGWKVGVGMSGFILLFAFTVGVVVNWGLGRFGIFL